jgi:hypothetical protein
MLQNNNRHSMLRPEDTAVVEADISMPIDGIKALHLPISSIDIYDLLGESDKTDWLLCISTVADVNNRPSLLNGTNPVSGRPSFFTNVQAQTVSWLKRRPKVVLLKF